MVTMTVASISSTADDIISDPANTNKILELVEEIGGGDDIVTIAAIKGLTKVFEHMLSNSWMHAVVAGTDDVATYQTWMRETYHTTYTTICVSLLSDNHIVSTTAFNSCKSLLSAECVFVKLSVPRLSELISAVMRSGNESLVQLLKDEIIDLDWKFCTLKGVERFASKCCQEKNKDTELTKKVFLFLKSIDVSECFSDEHVNKKAKNEATKTSYNIRKTYNNTWIQFLKMSKSMELYHEILTDLHQTVIPYMKNPKLLIDFLVDSYDLGGTTGLLALNSLFLLITQHNLDYPSFFPKLYRMLTPDLYHTEYVPRFFAMLDTFLKSPLLPAYLVAAFIKKLIRNALQAPPPIIMITIRLVTNLLKLHPSTKRLVHRGPNHQAVRSDPFNPDELDPTKCNALDSSLWELEVLAEHYCPGMSTVVQTLRKPTDGVCVELGLGKGYEAIYKEYLKMWGSEPPLEFNEPGKYEDTVMGEMFVL